MPVVDASVWVGRFLPNDAHHAPSYRWLQRQTDLGISIEMPIIALAEIAGAVARRERSSVAGTRAVSLLQRLPNTRLFLIDERLGQMSAGIAAALRLRGSDAIYVALAQRLNEPLVTWALEQLDRGKSATQTMTPDEQVP